MIGHLPPLPALVRHQNRLCLLWHNPSFYTNKSLIYVQHVRSHLCNMLVAVYMGLKNMGEYSSAPCSDDRPEGIRLERLGGFLKQCF